MTVTVQGPAGYPKPPYGSFSGKTPNVFVYSVLGAGGYPRAPYGSFAGKPAAPTGSSLPHALPFHATVGQLKSF